MGVELVVDDEKEFQEVEKDIYSYECNQAMTFSVYVRSTGQSYHYETQWFPETESWIPIPMR